jgi:glycosyltransferase involved in cell wall biosynthesis
MLSFPKPVNNLQGWPWTRSISDDLYSNKKKWPKISIVTPAFNQGRYIEETIRSVLLQGYPNLEYIIIDGGSNDETVDIIKKYEPWITYWISEPDKGQSHAINKGLARCTGDIFNWLNSDDCYTPGALFEVASIFVSKPEILVVSGYENYILDGVGLQEVYQGTFLDKTLEQTIDWCQVGQPSTFFKLSTFQSLGPVPEDLHYIMDSELWLRFLLLYGHTGFIKVEKPLVNFRLHIGSKTLNNQYENNFLFERSSIITDLQRFVNVPYEIIEFWVKSVYKTPKTYILERLWKFDSRIITKKDLRVFYIKKYINFQFQENNLNKAFWGIKHLIKDDISSPFLYKSLLKLLIKKFK